MKIKISYSKKMSAVKDSFHSMFPYLKIEFFDVFHSLGEATSKKHLISGDMSLEQLNPLIKEGIITITGSQTVQEIEQDFKEKFGLSIQVFRKQKDVWIETTHTDLLTLEKQNDMGKKIVQIKGEVSESWYPDDAAL